MANNLPITDIEKVADIAYAKKQRRQKAEDMAKSISPWLHRLYDAYMERGRFPILPYVIGDYYNDPLDKETAIIIAMLTVNMTETSAALDDLGNLRLLMGQHPYQDFFVSRGFALLSTGSEMDNNLGSFNSIKYGQIAKIIDSLWRTCDERGSTLKELFFKNVSMGMNPYTAFVTLDGQKFVNSTDYRINLLLTALCTDYGIGYNLWNFEGVENKLNCPITAKVKTIAGIIMPGSIVHGFSVDEVARIFRFNPIDFWYLQNAYFDVVKLNISGCKNYIRRYRSQYRNNSHRAIDRYALKQLEPPIIFPK